LTASSIGVIKDPTPNMVEKEYVELVKIKEYSAELQDEEFIFKPFSIVGDSKGNLLVYDILQAKIFKLDDQLNVIKSFGSVGEGPREFFGTRMPVFLSMGLDGNIHANDLHPKKVISFTTDLEFIDQYRYKWSRMVVGPVAVDARGNVHFLEIKGNTVECWNQNDKLLFNFTASDEDLSTLFYKRSGSTPPGHDRVIALTPQSFLLIFFRDSSTLFVLKNNKVVRKKRLWPRDALLNYKPKLKKTIGSIKHTKHLKNAFMTLFGRFLIDNDEPDKFYLSNGSNETKSTQNLYRFTINGELKKVLYLKEQRPFVRFVFKKDGKYYGILRENILIYKEKEEQK
jgi:hypothetical protein